MVENKQGKQESKGKFPKDKIIIWAIIIPVILIFILKQDKNTAPPNIPIPENLPEESFSTKDTSPAEEYDVPKNTISEKLPQLLDLGSTSCIPCKMMQPILEELDMEYKGQLVVKFIDVYKDSSIAEKYNIRGIPTQIFLDAEGKEISRNVGFMPKEDILARWKSLGYEFKKEALPEKQEE